MDPCLPHLTGNLPAELSQQKKTEQTRDSFSAKVTLAEQKQEQIETPLSTRETAACYEERLLRRRKVQLTDLVRHLELSDEKPIFAEPQIYSQEHSEESLFECRPEKVAGASSSLKSPFRRKLSSTSLEAKPWPTIIQSCAPLLNFKGEMEGGSQGEIYTVKLWSEEQEYIAKSFSGDKDAIPKELFTEYKYLTQVRDHHAFVRTEGLKKIYGRPVLVLEKIQGLNLRELEKKFLEVKMNRDIKVRDDEDIPEMPEVTNTVVHIALQLFEALEYLESNGIAHNDIKPANIMIDRECRVRIIDFGIACEASISSQACGIRGTFGYLAPELLAPSKSGDIDRKKIDVYAAANTMLGALTCHRVYQDNQLLIDIYEAEIVKEEELMECIGSYITGRHSPNTMQDLDVTINFDPQSSLYDGLISIFVKCLCSNVSERPTASEVLIELKQLAMKEKFIFCPAFFNGLYQPLEKQTKENNATEDDNTTVELSKVKLRKLPPILQTQMSTMEPEEISILKLENFHGKKQIREFYQEASYQALGVKVRRSHSLGASSSSCFKESGFSGIEKGVRSSSDLSCSSILSNISEGSSGSSRETTTTGSLESSKNNTPTEDMSTCKLVESLNTFHAQTSLSTEKLKMLSECSATPATDEEDEKEKQLEPSAFLGVSASKDLTD